MNSSFPPSASGEEVARGVFNSIKNQYERDFADKYWPDSSVLNDEVIKDEWLFFDIFIFDLSTFLAFGNTSKREAVLNPFQDCVANWMQQRIVCPIPEARLWIFNYSEEPKVFPPENSEPATTRLSRRLASYSEVIALSNSTDGNFAVASVFAKLCGTDDPSFIAGVSAYFSQMKINTVGMLKSIKITGSKDLESINIILAHFQKRLSPKQAGFLSRWLLNSRRILVGYVEQFNPTGDWKKPIAIWRITANSVEQLPANFEIPKPVLSDPRRSFEFARFTFTLPDQTGCGTMSSSSGPRAFYSHSYCISSETGVPEIKNMGTLAIS